jgi:hypothetical protein
MTDPFRALCAELAEELVKEYGYCTEWEKGLPLCESNVSELLNRVRAELAKPEPVAPTDEELARRFRVWWHYEGSGLPPLPSMDHEEHVRRISEIAWANGAYAALAQSEATDG